MHPTSRRLLLDDPEAVLRDGRPLMDVRAPIEYAAGTLPGAVNLPLLTDDERAEVGTRYKQEGSDAAVRLGHKLVTGAVKAGRLDSWIGFARAHSDGALFCFRGGMRSQLVQEWLGEAGVEMPRIQGGFKAMRSYLLEKLDAMAAEMEVANLNGLPTHGPLAPKGVLVLGGLTGSGKTELLSRLANGIDLEAFARHRGSAFGGLHGGQSSQIDFENGLILQMLRLRWNFPDATALFEDESRQIGRCSIPLPLHQAMQSAPLVLLEAPLEERVQRSFHAYVSVNLRELEDSLGPEEGFNAFSDSLLNSIEKIRRRLGGAATQEIRSIMESALARHLAGDPEGHREWISRLLTDYYDPMYAWQIERKASRIVHQGSQDELLAWFSTLRSE